MKLYEYEGKMLLKSDGFLVPQSSLTRDAKDLPINIFPAVCKAQILLGNRLKNGGVLFPEKSGELSVCTDALLRGFSNEIEAVLVEERIAFDKEYFISFSASIKDAWVLLTYSDQGGSGIEKRGTKQYRIDVVSPRFPVLDIPEHILIHLFSIFISCDCELLEINPLVKREKSSEWIALDARIILDDLALSRHPEFDFPNKRHKKSHTNEREALAQDIDRGDHRGSAGSTYVDLDGDIGMLPSGGGASLVAIDALVRSGGKPANYTEYSGNPTGDKVKKLVSIVASKPGLSALWVVGAIANFTDIYETLTGFIEGLRSLRKEEKLSIDYPIIIRRGGPRDKEAYEMLQQVNDFDLHLFSEETSIEESAQLVVTLAHDFKNKKTHSR